MAWKNGFVIEYLPKKNSGKNSCYNCLNSNKIYKCCNVKPIVFSEDGYGYWKYCKEYKPNDKVKHKKIPALEVAESPSKSKSADKLHKKTKTIKHDKASRIKKSKPIIHRANSKNLLNNKTELLKDIEENNFIGLWDIKGEIKTCDCGGTLKYSDSNEICFRIDDQYVYVGVPGKYCSDCKKMFVVKDILVNHIRSI